MRAVSLNEVWGLAMHPWKKNIYCTTGDDMTLRAWDMEYQQVIGTNN